MLVQGEIPYIVTILIKHSKVVDKIELIYLARYKKDLMLSDLMIFEAANQKICERSYALLGKRNTTGARN
ncbi:hypothetical protein NIES3585_16740 [Nodularia sp. NIES-3585]|nr:hypothetical protein NIES3585_16740 [Nodularia sp. NIES-3585]